MEDRLLASLFKAATWEELRMLAEKNPILEDALETIYDLTADEAVREQCNAREKHIREMNTVMKEREIAVRERDVAIQGRDEAVQKLDAAVQERDEAVRQIEQQSKQIEQLLQENKRLKEQQALTPIS